MKVKSVYFSIIIPAQKLTKKFVNETLIAFTKQTYLDFELILLIDKKSDLCKELIKNYNWLRIKVLDNFLTVSEKRNLGANLSTGKILAFIDSDAFPEKNWLTEAKKLFEIKNVAAIGGPGIMPKNSNFWQKLFYSFLASSFGSLNYTYRFVAETDRYVDDYPSMNFFIKTEIFNKIGGFQKEYYPGEDSKLCNEIVYSEKQKILYSPLIITYHYRRDNLYSHLTQYANYGYHRGLFVVHKDVNSLKPVYFLPLFFIIYLCLITILLLLNKLHIIVFGFYIYLIISFYFAILSGIKYKNIGIALLFPLIAFQTQTTYGLFFTLGIIKGIFTKNERSK